MRMSAENSLFERTCLNCIMNKKGERVSSENGLGFYIVYKNERCGCYVNGYNLKFAGCSDWQSAESEEYDLFEEVRDADK